jgi:hypothetical protein
MFFIPRGTEGIDKVMPFESFKQMAQGFVEAYIRIYETNEHGTFIVKPLITYDATSRGYGWNADDDYRSGADEDSSGLT